MKVRASVKPICDKYIIDLEKNTAVPLINVLSAYKNFIILEPDDSVVKPEGYNPFKYDFGGN